MTLSLTNADEKLTESVARVQQAGERVVLKRRGKAAAAIVSIEDLRTLEKLEALEDASDARVAKRRLAAIRAGKMKTIPWNVVKKRLREAERDV